MADNEQVKDPKLEKLKLKEEHKKLKDEQKLQKKEAKVKAKEITAQAALIEDESDENGGIPAFLVTILIILIWIGILVLLIKLDVGGFGSGVLSPIIKDVPVINKILPADRGTEVPDSEEAYYGYTSLKDAVEQIKVLEIELSQAQSSTSQNTDEVSALKAEIERLKTFEDNQVDFQRIKTEFYEEVIYAENGPGAEAYKKYYETMDPTTSEYLYKQVVLQLEEDKEITEYAAAYSEMKPKEAAAIFEAMADNLDLAARILGVMDNTKRGKILGVMDPEVAAKITKIMDPEG